MDKAGHILLRGELPDGTDINQSATLSSHGEWPLYVPLSGGRGSLLGWMHFSDTPGRVLTGTLIRSGVIEIEVQGSRISDPIEQEATERTEASAQGHATAPLH